MSFWGSRAEPCLGLLEGTCPMVRQALGHGPHMPPLAATTGHVLPESLSTPCLGLLEATCLASQGPTLLPSYSGVHQWPPATFRG